MESKLSIYLKKLINTMFRLYRIGIVLAASIILVAVLALIQHDALRREQAELSACSLAAVDHTLDSNGHNADDLTRIFHEINQSTLEDLKALLRSGGTIDVLIDGSNKEKIELFEDIITRSGVKCLYLIDANGRVVRAPVEDYFGHSLSERGILSHENLAALKAGTRDGQEIKPVYESNLEGDNYFYSTSIDSQNKTYYLILEADSNILDIQFASIYDITRVLKYYTVNDTAFMFAVSTKTGRFIYYDDGLNCFTGEPVEEHGIPLDAVCDGFEGEITIDGKEYFCVSKEVNPNLIVFDVKATSTLYQKSRRLLILALVAFPLIAMICMAMIEVLSLMKLVPILVAFSIAIFFSFHYAQTLVDLSSAIENAEITLARIEPRIKENAETQMLVQSYYDERFLNKAMLLSYYLEEEPSVLNVGDKRVYTEYDENGLRQIIWDSEGNPLQSVPLSEQLIKLADRNGIADILIYDEQGRVICTTEPEWYFTLSHDPEAQSYKFREIIDQKRDYYIQEPQTNEIGIFREYIGTEFNYYTCLDENENTLYVSRQDYQKQENGEWDGFPITRHRSMLQIGLDSNLIEFLGSSTDITSVLDDFIILQNSFMMGFTADENHTLLYTPHKVNIGKTAEELGMTKIAFSGYYNGFFFFNGTEYLECIRKMNDSYYVGATIPVASIHRYRLPVVAATTLLSLLYLLAIVILSKYFLLRDGEDNRDIFRVKQFAANGFGNNRLKDAVGIMTHAPEPEVKQIRFGTGKKKWKDKTPEQKCRALIRYAVMIILCCLLIMIMYSRRIHGEQTLTDFIFTNNWDKELNIFAITAALSTMAFAFVVITISTRMIHFITAMLGSKTETLGQLVASVIKYGGTILCMFYCLHLVGVDSSSLLASAGIMSVILGLGAQKLVGDIISGMFIIFEGEFIVGEIVNINGFRGQVIDIGLRTTKLIDDDKNIKIFNNSEISGVMNMTRELSLVKCSIPLDYGVDLTAFEQMIKREAPNIRKQLPKVVEGPFYRHVTNFEGSDILVRIDVLCNEVDFIPLQRQLNQVVYQTCVKNGFEVPYEHFVLMMDKDKENAAPHTQK